MKNLEKSHNAETVEKPKKQRQKPKLYLEHVIVMKGKEGIQKLYTLFDKPPFRSVVLKIYPDVANIILQHFHKTNRPEAKGNLNKINLAFSKDSWRLTGDTLKFSNQEELMDGQHRLTGCIISNTPIITHAIFGLPPDTFSFLDTGKTRTPGDLIAMEKGTIHATVIAAAIRLIHLHDHGYYPKEWLNDDYLERYRTIQKDISKCYEFMHPIYNAYKWPRSMTLALDYLIQIKKTRLAKKFFEDWLYANHIGRNKIFNVLQRRIINSMSNGQARMRRHIRFAILILTFNIWHNWQDGDTADIKKLQWHPRTDFPKLEIQK